jgi:hypothetical protein
MPAGFAGSSHPAGAHVFPSGFPSALQRTHPSLDDMALWPAEKRALKKTSAALCAKFYRVSLRGSKKIR